MSRFDHEGQAETSTVVRQRNDSNEPGRGAACQASERQYTVRCGVVQNAWLRRVTPRSGRLPWWSWLCRACLRGSPFPFFIARTPKQGAFAGNLRTGDESHRAICHPRPLNGQGGDARPSFSSRMVSVLAMFPGHLRTFWPPQSQGKQMFPGERIATLGRYPARVRSLSGDN